MKISRHCLRVQNQAELAEFYSDFLGMRAFTQSQTPAYGYDPAQCLIEFHEGEGEYLPYQSTRNDFYWKIGITLRDLDIAVAYLQQRQWAVSEPRQFRDIGYMCHLQDPQGFNIELLQQGFEGNSKPIKTGHPLGAQAILAHLTLRITDIAAARAYCEKELHMRLMSVQPVPERGFCLYFYAWSDESLPHPSLEAVENREWLWARPYTLLELQHLQSADAFIRRLTENTAGFSGFAYGAEDDQSLNYLSAKDWPA